MRHDGDDEMSSSTSLLDDKRVSQEISLDVIPEDEPDAYVSMNDISTTKRNSMGFFQGILQFFVTLFLFTIVHFPTALCISLFLYIYTVFETIPSLQHYYLIYVLYFTFTVILIILRNMVISIISLRIGLLWSCCSSSGLVDISSWYALIMKWIPYKIVSLCSGAVESFVDTALYNLFI